VGRVVSLSVSPKADQIALTNHRNELVLVDLASQNARVLDRSEHFPMLGFDFSPDGRWIAYACAQSLHTSVIKLCSLDDGRITPVTRPVLIDLAPTFDPEGRYLYFLSRREFDPVYDGLHFDLGFPKGMRPYLVTLQRDLPNPFVLQPKPAADSGKDAAAKPADASSASGDSSKNVPLRIDLEGIENRILAFPVPEGIYQQIEAIPGKALFTSVPVEGALKLTWIPGGEPPAKATLEMWDFATAKSEPVVSNISSFAVSGDRKTLVYRAGARLRTIKAGEKSDDAQAAKPPGRESGWIDLKRVRLSIDPSLEWKQMFGEAWRLQREHFWVDDLSQVDWPAVYDRYAPLLDRVATRTEFTDLLTEMHGELGSSHAYVVGGDFRDEPRYDLGFLGADLSFDAKLSAWQIDRIAPGDPWDEEKASPLARAGADVRVGDTILAVNGRRVSQSISPQQLLVHQAGTEVMLTVADAEGKNPRTVPIKTLKTEMPLRYREWVEKNRAYVHEKSGGKFGYVHIPNMGPVGYAEFHRYFLAEVDHEGLVIDVRYNGGGHVSSLLLEKLARRRCGYVHTRWFGVQPHPDDCPAGPMVCITNEHAGSDGDIFSHNFKHMNLGTLLGKRTWGGVIGIWPRHTLIDGGVTTQPEFSFWFSDVGWNVENHGVDPDIEVEYRPQDYVAGIDPQLDRALAELKKAVAGAPATRAFDDRPNLALPRGLRSANGSPKVDAATGAG
jgi:tricorn protease